MPTLADQFQAYVLQLTGQTLSWLETPRPALPAYLSQRYEPRCVALAGQTWLVALLKSPTAPAPLQVQTHLQQLRERFAAQSLGICLVAQQLPPHLRRRLVELAQPFAIPGRQLFWPALGSIETAQRVQRLMPTPVEKLSPVAQQLLIALLLRQLTHPITIGGASKTLGCTAMSISQAVKAMEGSGLVQSERHGRERSFDLAGTPREVWKRAQPLLRSPVRQRLRLMQAELPDQPLLRAGETALAEATMLAEPLECSFAVASRNWNVQPRMHIPTADAGTCIVELWRYAPEPLATKQRVDPLSLHLSLRDTPDERVQIALEELMEQMQW